MPSLRFPLIALLFVATISSARAGDASDATQSAMQCIRAAMTDSLLPVGVMNEQIAGVALMRCSDEIEQAVGVLSAATKAGGIEATRVALRVELYDYAMDVAGRSYAVHANVSDVSDGRVEGRSW